MPCRPCRLQRPCRLLAGNIHCLNNLKHPSGSSPLIRPHGSSLRSLLFRRSITGPASNIKPPSDSGNGQASEGQTKRSTLDRPKYGRWLLLGGLFALGVYAYSSEAAPQDTQAFRTFRLENRQDVSSNSALFTIVALQGGLRAPKDQIWSVEFKQPYIQISRDYTPLPILSETDENYDSLTFLIRRDPKGEMSRYLYSLPTGAELEIRGPRTEFIIPSNAEHMVFFAGGTGIAPALQAVENMLSRDSISPQRTKTVHLLWANRRREDCLGAPAIAPEDSSAATSWTDIFNIWLSKSESRPVQPIGTSECSRIVSDLQMLQSRYPGQFKVDYYIDEERTFISHEIVKQAIQRLPVGDTVGTNQVIVSGPDGFVSYIAGAKYQAAQGPVGGLLADLRNGDRKVSVLKL